MMQIITKLDKQGAEAIILGCTDLPLLVSKLPLILPVINTIEVLENAAINREKQE